MILLICIFGLVAGYLIADLVHRWAVQLHDNKIRKVYGKPTQKVSLGNLYARH